ncbi:hypothetical protein ACFLRM_04785 [Acidobacteriota bacterium]
MSKRELHYPVISTIILSQKDRIPANLTSTKISGLDKSIAVHKIPGYTEKVKSGTDFFPHDIRKQEPRKNTLLIIWQTESTRVINLKRTH